MVQRRGGFIHFHPGIKWRPEQTPNFRPHILRGDGKDLRAKQPLAGKLKDVIGFPYLREIMGCKREIGVSGGTKGVAKLIRHAEEYIRFIGCMLWP